MEKLKVNGFMKWSNINEDVPVGYARRDPQGMEADYTPATAGAEMADLYHPQGDLVEELTDKTIKQSDKVKVARMIADMLGVEKAESMSPEVAINTGLRHVKTKRMTPELIGVLRKMLGLASDVGIKVDMSLVPKAVTEQKDEEDVVVDPASDYNAAKGILRLKDYMRLSKVGHALHPDDPGPEDEQLRRRKVKYKTEEVDLQEISLSKAAEVHGVRVDQYHAAKKSGEGVDVAKAKMQRAHKQLLNKDKKTQTEDVATADYKVNPETGRKHGAGRINFANSGMKDKLEPEAIKEEDDKEDTMVDMSDDDLEKMVNDISHEDHILDVYDPDELTIVDTETGEEVEDEEDEVNEEVLNEVLSRIERMRARIKFMQSKSKRQRRLQIALKRRSDTPTINKRARRLAIKILKQRIAKKTVDKMSVAEKERVERMLEKRKALINRLAMRLAPRIRRIESDRLSHKHTTAPAPTGGI